MRNTRILPRLVLVLHDDDIAICRPGSDIGHIRRDLDDCRAGLLPPGSAQRGARRGCVTGRSRCLLPSFDRGVGRRLRLGNCRLFRFAKSIAVGLPDGEHHTARDTQYDCRAQAKQRPTKSAGAFAPALSRFLVQSERAVQIQHGTISSARPSSDPAGMRHSPLHHAEASELR